MERIWILCSSIRRGWLDLEDEVLRVVFLFGDVVWYRSEDRIFLGFTMVIIAVSHLYAPSANLRTLFVAI